MPIPNRLLIQVVARLKPERCGVSDFAMSLARELDSVFGINTAFAVLNSNERHQSAFPAVYCAPSQLLESCNSLSKGQPGTLLVHVSGYGFSRDGAPMELAKALARVRESGRFRIAVYFHELYASGMPWKRQFWYQHRQKRSIRMIGRESELIATNLSLHADWLQREVIHGGPTPLLRLPVFSNVGESLSIPPLSTRRPAMVVFGLPGTRKRSYSQLSSMRATLRYLDIDEILDIGTECGAPSSLHGTPIRRMGVQTAAEVKALLLESRFGFVPHPPHALAKSGIFAALSALGTIPVLAKSFSGQVDGLRDGVHVISPPLLEGAVKNDLQCCSMAAWRWYSDHRLHVHAATFAQLLFALSTEGVAGVSSDTPSSEKQN